MFSKPYFDKRVFPRNALNVLKHKTCQFAKGEWAIIIQQVSSFITYTRKRNTFMMRNKNHILN